jgi:putative NADPH-quinone reductase
MRISVLLAHPNPGSFNHAIANEVRVTLQKAGHSVVLHDLYAEGFDPVLPAGELKRDGALPPLVRRHCEEITQAEGLVFVHPNWWGMPPAMLTGWVDRVIRPGVAYRFQEGDAGAGVPIGLLKVRAALIFNTSDTPPEREQKVFGDPLETIWKNCILGFCGVVNVRRETFSVVVASTPEQRKEWLRRASEAAVEIFK